MAVSMDKCEARVRVRDACIDDVQTNQIKEIKNKKNKTHVYWIWRFSQNKI